MASPGSLVLKDLGVKLGREVMLVHLEPQDKMGSLVQ
jgi:hypothetical protein